MLLHYVFILHYNVTLSFYYIMLLYGVLFSNVTTLLLILL